MSKRHAISELHCTGVSNSMIIKQLKVPKSTVYDAVARFKELGDHKDIPRSGCHCTTWKQRNTLETKTSPSNKMMLLPTHPKRLKRGAELIF